MAEGAIAYRPTECKGHSVFITTPMSIYVITATTAVVNVVIAIVSSVVVACIAKHAKLLESSVFATHRRRRKLLGE